MMQEPHIYAVIIGSEILDRRRQDKHFEYLSQALAKKGHKLHACLIIKDDKALIEQTFHLVKNDPRSLLFSFGGIGSTPDDLTRAIAAECFEDGQLYRHPVFEQAIIDRLQERAYPNSIRMSDLPRHAQLLHNPVNNMSGFYLQERFFFMPGFPEMAHPMIEQIIHEHLEEAATTYSRAFFASCGEGKIQHLMHELPEHIELSSLPMLKKGIAHVELTLSSSNEEELILAFKKFTDFLTQEEIGFKHL